VLRDKPGQSRREGCPKANREKALAVDQLKIGERLAITKQRYRVIIQKLWRIIDGHQHPHKHCVDIGRRSGDRKLTHHPKVL